MDEYLDDGIQNSQQSYNNDIDMLDQLLNDITQNSQQPQDAATQSVQQSPNDATQSAHQYQGPDAQEIGQLRGASPKNIQALLNFLAQTPQQSQDAATQSTQQSQGAATHSAQQSDQDEVLAEINRLTEALKMQDGRCSQIKRHIRSDKQKNTEVNDMMKTIAMKFRRPSLSSDKKLELQKMAHNLIMVSDESVVRYIEQHQRYTYDMTIRNEMYAELQLLKENQELIAKHNSKNEVKVELSPNSCYNIGILETQYDDIIKDTDRLLVKHKRTRDAMILPGGDALKAESKKFENEIHTLQHYNVVAKRILC
ncbi:hypothetical protein BASA50_008487 [Batrachochytrium salamandrivorans]|uniref:Syntaxin N-terminal domain-containing protein n=1 Tax=Batrachochytrium salamandrivorans TaxID=1357716 RepID=A0ABQ8F432_9FUNG|nr:hypothetical protein BASA60_004385 [Batrachochytrium salamandrivorans]KAH6591778.1 hypothetical protein BASA50_008487 [Batrachochytrium salamandrivorans]KAH9270881.1 hypothetical protein BASA83_007034 [Batrachochytrium salamandrivorans]